MTNQEPMKDVEPMESREEKLQTAAVLLVIMAERSKNYLRGKNTEEIEFDMNNSKINETYNRLLNGDDWKQIEKDLGILPEIKKELMPHA